MFTDFFLPDFFNPVFRPPLGGWKKCTFYNKNHDFVSILPVFFLLVFHKDNIFYPQKFPPRFARIFFD